MLLLGLLTVSAVLALDNGIARLPPMGWMSWTAFYCEMDCVKHPTACINEQLYKDMADRLGIVSFFPQISFFQSVTGTF